MSEYIKSEIADGVLTLTLNRPEKKNANIGKITCSQYLPPALSSKFSAWMKRLV